MKYDPTASFDVRTVDVDYLTVDGDTFVATLYLPDGQGPFPAMLDVYGGAWTSGHRGTDAVVARGISSSGVVVMSMDFRVAPKHPYPAQVQDVHFAIRWLKAHASDYGITPESVGAFGASSGGNTAMLCAMKSDDPVFASHSLAGPTIDARLRYVIPCWPILDPYHRYFFAIETGRQDLITRTEGYFPNPEDMKVGNPQLILDRGESAELPPVLLIQGTADTNLNMAMSMKFVASYKSRGGDATLEQFPGMPHGFMSEPRPETDKALKLMKEFIARQVRSIQG